jgi:hypothetical protein
MPSDDDADAQLIAERIVAIAPLLHGLGPAQGAVLADLVAMWLAGHMVPDSPGDPAADGLRAELFEHWQDSVWQLVEVNEDHIRMLHGLPRKPPKGE